MKISTNYNNGYSFKQIPRFQLTKNNKNKYTKHGYIDVRDDIDRCIDKLYPIKHNELLSGQKSAIKELVNNKVLDIILFNQVGILAEAQEIEKKNSSPKTSNRTRYYKSINAKNLFITKILDYLEPFENQDNPRFILGHYFPKKVSNDLNGAKTSERQKKYEKIDIIKDNDIQDIYPGKANYVKYNYTLHVNPPKDRKLMLFRLHKETVNHIDKKAKVLAEKIYEHAITKVVKATLADANEDVQLNLGRKMTKKEKFDFVQQGTKIALKEFFSKFQIYNSDYSAMLRPEIYR